MNNCAYTLTSGGGLAPSLGASLADGARDARHAGLGDPYQILTENLVPGPLTEGVRKVQLYNLRTLKASKQKTAPKAVPVVKIPVGAESGADAAAMMAVEHGKGRMFLSADAMAFQPFRIELADNAALLENIVGWLLNRPVTPEMRDAFRANLAVSSLDLQQRKGEKSCSMFQEEVLSGAWPRPRARACSRSRGRRI